MRDRRITLLAICKWGLALVLLSWCAVAWINAFDVIHTRDWIRVPATIDTLTAINHQGERLTPFGEWDGRGTLLVKYHYEVEGTIQDGTRIGIETFGDSSRRAVRWRDLNATSPDVHAWYNPGSPSESTLYRDTDWLTLTFSSIFGTFWSWAIWIDARRRRVGKPGFW
jgi:hypothetical protein